ncbi:hypothetical protein PTSG_13182 [Salpingoeca rosetta]|uniref:Uncharacterized protein n=1 Tax=Salpingoeca rosetta (strain ATCC 50818 / BSB-021) TaxID=946362 RepID=F2UT85_SALR5|nr:uncharacterized protein PTSG_13182 [Salpingoeca rosetta]EGD81344.1 hypothetical protein PTSG_13182 [Salpingoeca rosetta]|eukprot:XP_004987621.1 hypothetical protein PTSG_13182 [Salpingoeca rosetta]
MPLLRSDRNHRNHTHERHATPRTRACVLRRSCCCLRCICPFVIHASDRPLHRPHYPYRLLPPSPLRPPPPTFLPFLSFPSPDRSAFSHAPPSIVWVHGTP